MNILVTGVAGFLGSHLADAMIAEGYRVIGVDNLIGGELDNVPSKVIFHIGRLIGAGPAHGFEWASAREPGHPALPVETGDISGRRASSSGVGRILRAPGWLIAFGWAFGGGPTLSDPRIHRGGGASHPDLPVKIGDISRHACSDATENGGCAGSITQPLGVPQVGRKATQLGAGANPHHRREAGDPVKRAGFERRIGKRGLVISLPAGTPCASVRLHRTGGAPRGKPVAHSYGLAGFFAGAPGAGGGVAGCGGAT